MEDQSLTPRENLDNFAIFLIQQSASIMEL